MKSVNVLPPSSKDERHRRKKKDFNVDSDYDNDKDNEDKVLVIIIIKQAVAVDNVVSFPSPSPPNSFPFFLFLNPILRGSLTYLFQIILTRQCRCIAHDDGFRHKYLQILQSMGYYTMRMRMKCTLKYVGPISSLCHSQSNSHFQCQSQSQYHFNFYCKPLNGLQYVEEATVTGLHLNSLKAECVVVADSLNSIMQERKNLITYVLGSGIVGVWTEIRLHVNL